MPNVSIIVPVYNAESTLADCVDSLLNQTLSSIEIILADDGSTDQSPALCDAFARKDDRVHVLHIQDSGPAAARNAGLETAKGDFIGFADADDTAEPALFATLLERANETGADLSLCDYFAVSPQSETVCSVIPGKSRAFSREEIRAQILPYFFGYAPGELAHFGSCCPFADSRSYVWLALYRADMLRENAVRFPDEKLYYTEDNLFNLQAVFCAARLVYTAAPLYRYRLSGNTFTSRFKPDYFACRLRKYQYLEDFAARRGLPAEMASRLPRKICAETPTLLNYYASLAPGFSKKYLFVSKILHHPVIQKALAAVPASERPAGRLGLTLTAAQKKWALPILLACLAQKKGRALRAKKSR